MASGPTHTGANDRTTGSAPTPPQASGLYSFLGPLTTLACNSAAALRRTFIGQPETPVVSPTPEGVEFDVKFFYDKSRDYTGYLFSVSRSDGTIRQELRQLLGRNNAIRLEADWHNRGVSLAGFSAPSTLALFTNSTDMPRDRGSADGDKIPQEDLLRHKNCKFADDVVATLWLARLMKKAKDLGADLRYPIDSQMERLSYRQKPRTTHAPAVLEGGRWVQPIRIMSLSPGELQALARPVRTRSGILFISSSGHLEAIHDPGYKSFWVRALGSPDSK